MWVLIVICVLYVLSWWLHPLMNCPACKGSPRHSGALHTTKFRLCHVCGGSGRAVRPGARMLRSMGLMKYPPERTGTFGWYRRNRRG